MITVRYSSIDHYHKTSQFKTLEGARKFAVRCVGEHPDFGSTYAVSDDGVGKVTVEGCTLRDLFEGEATKALPYEVWYYEVNEFTGTSRAFRATAFATLAEANADAEKMERYSDGVHLVGTTAAAKAEIKDQSEAYEAQLQRDYADRWF